MASIADLPQSEAPIQHMVRPAKVGITSWLTTVDHKKIAIMYGVAATFYFLLGGLEALIFRAQLSVSNAGLISGETYNALVTMHATTMVFMAVMPMAASLSNLLIPLMIGARDVAFPRLNAFSLWMFIAGSLVLNASFLFGAPSAGWFGYAPLTGNDYSGIGVDFWALGLVLLATSSMSAGVNFVVTVFNLRAPGMTLMRVPVMVWMLTVIQFLLAFSFPPVAVGLILLIFDRFFGTTFYLVSMGGDPQLWQHLFWLFGHPEVYVLILPSMGVVSEVLPVFSRKPLFGQTFVIFSGIFIGFVGFGVWAHHMFTGGMGPLADSAFSIATMIIAIPTGVKIFNWLGTIWGGKIRFTVAMMFATSFIPLFTIGGLSGVMLASPPLDLQVHDSYFVVAHFHYVLVGGAIIGLFSGMYYWYPKFTGRLMSERLGKIHFWLFVIGLNLTFFPQHFLGNWGMPRRIYTYPPDAGWDAVNMLCTIGALIMAAGTGVLIYNMVISAVRGEKAGRDPWDASTLEWLTASPPAPHNFDFTPVVLSERPLWDHKHTPGMQIEEPTQPEVIHMPAPSWKPLWVSLAVVGFVLGLLLTRFNFYGDANPDVWVGYGIMIFSGLMIPVTIYRWIDEPC